MYFTNKKMAMFLKLFIATGAALEIHLDVDNDPEIH